MVRFHLVMGIVGLILIIAGAIIYGVFYTSGLVAFLPLLAGLVLSIVTLVSGYRSSSSEGNRRSARYGINAGISIMVTVAIMIFIQTLATRHSVRLDTTVNRRFSLSQQTIKVIRNLDTDILITCFFRETSAGKIELNDLLSEYTNQTPRIKVRFIDPDRDPVAARRYNLKDYEKIFMEAAGKKEEIQDISEEKFTNAIYRIVSSDIKTIYFTTGHGEKSIESVEPSGLSSFHDALKLENYEVREFLPLGSEKIPVDCSLIVIAGPRTDFLKAEQNIILDYLTKGGNALILLEPVTDIPVLSGITGAFGIKPRNDIIIDPNGMMLTGNYLTPVVNQYGKHPITDGFRLFSFFPQARSLSIYNRLPDAMTVTVIGKTDKDAYAESNVDTLLAIGKTQYESEKDLAGPIIVAIAAEMELVLGRPDSSVAAMPEVSRLVVFGDSDFAGNSRFRMSGNRDLVLNAINWLAEEEDLVSIRPSDALNQPVLLSSRQGRIVFWIPVVGIPSLVSILGLLVFLRKRQFE